MMRSWSLQQINLWAVAALLLTGVAFTSAQEGSPFGPAAGDQFFSADGPARKNQHLRFEASVASSDPFSPINQAGSKTGHKARRGEVLEVVLTVTPEKGYYTYPLTQRSADKDGQLEAQPDGQLAKIDVQGGPYLVPLYPPRESPLEWENKGFGWMLEHKTPFTWTYDVLVKPDAPADSTQELTFNIKAQVCKTSCFVETYTVKVSVPISSEEPLTPPADFQARMKPVAPTAVAVPPELARKSATAESPSSTPSATEDSLGSSGGGAQSVGLWQAILLAVGGGFVSLLTPCVFPMIPITVSYFLKQSESKQGNAVLMALLYSGTIVLILAAGGLFLLKVLTQISTHPLTNFALGAVFLFFGLSLLGWYDITLPSWLQDATASREGKGGYFGVFFMALTFSIVSFSCVGPIYGGFISVKAAGSAEQLQLVLSVVAFAVAFASPFFLLALFPGLIKAMPRAGSWMNSVKVVMGFLELAAVVKFLRAGELASTGAAEYLSYDLSLGIYVALSAACALYLLGVYLLPHDHEAPETIGVPRLLFSLVFLAMAIYMTPGLFKTASGQSMRPGGRVFSWIDSFLLPDPESKAPESGGPQARSEGLVWNTKLSTAVEQARKENKLVFLDFTGTLCTNCKLNERDAFPRPEIQAAFRKHVLLKLYTDTVPAGVDQVPGASEALDLRNSRFKSAALPLYAVLQPDGDDFKVVRVYDRGLIQSAGERQEFVDFLTK